MYNYHNLTSKYLSVINLIPFCNWWTYWKSNPPIASRMLLYMWQYQSFPSELDIP